MVEPQNRLGFFANQERLIALELKQEPRRKKSIPPAIDPLVEQISNGSCHPIFTSSQQCESSQSENC